jgi:uncharacterized protein YidB (DUF937 family)
MNDLSTMLSGESGTGGMPADPAALGGLTQAIQGAGGFGGLIDALRGAGLGSAVDSWVSTGTNQPVDPDQLGQALGPDTVQRLSAGSGIDIVKLLPLLAAFLPQIIDMLTPDGQVPQAGVDKGPPGLDSILGGLLGGSGLGGLLGGTTAR